VGFPRRVSEMANKRRDRAQGAAEKKARRDRRRLTRDEKLREEHARLVVERSNDPRFSQRIHSQDGTIVYQWPADTPQGKQFREAIEGQIREFREKFGREPGPDDPLFFDRDADEPRTLDESAMAREMTRAIREAGAKAEIDPAIIEAWCELGYVVTEDDEHLLSASEILAWDEAYRRHAGHLDEDDELGAAEEVDEDLTDVSLSEIYDGLERVIAATVAGKTLDAVKNLIGAFSSLMESVGDEEEEHSDVARWTFGSTFALLASWLTGARENGLSEADARLALGWVSSIDTDADSVTDYALRVAGLIGHPDAPQDMTVNELIDEMGPVVIGAMALIAAGLVATIGHGDAYWLRQFDLTGYGDGE
jgi:hypothetical protein